MQWLERLFQVSIPGLAQEFPSLETAITHPNNLTELLTSFVGRKEEIIEVSALLSKHRLVTLTGSGGVGKTRLALRVGKDMLTSFHDGVWLVELATLGDPNKVAMMAAQVLGLREISGIPIEKVLSGFIHDKRLLLILDNCEHLLEACSRLADLLLKKCSQLTLLATSREILGVAGEIPFRVPSMATPDPKHLPDLAQMAGFEAVHLFVMRAEQVAPGLELNNDNAAAISTICRRLDGIPLAIELAAARTRVMTPQQIAGRLDKVFRLLTGGSRSVLPRQQTLEATIGWSYALLSERECQALQRLSVFAGGWTLEAAEAVVSGIAIQADEVLDLLTSLLDKSLIQTASSSEAWMQYRMLETVRQYAHERLLESGFGERVRDRHLAYYLGLAEQAEPHLRGKGMLDWLNRLEDEHDNLRLALEWSLADHFFEGLCLASSLMWFWHVRNFYAEGIDWLEGLLNVEAEARGSPPLEAGRQTTDYLRAWCRAVAALSDLAMYHSGSLTLEQRTALLEESIVFCRAMGQEASRELAFALQALGGYRSLNVEQSHRYIEEALEISRKNGYEFIEEACLQDLSAFALLSGNIQQAKAYIEQSISLCQKIEDLDGYASQLILLSSVVHLEGDRLRAINLSEKAQAYYRNLGNMVTYYWTSVSILYLQYQPETIKQAEAALQYFRETQNISVLFYCLINFMEVEWSDGNDERAEQLGQEALDIFPAPGSIPFTVFYILLFLWQGRLALTRGDLNQAQQNFSSMLSWVKEESGVTVDVLIQVLDALAVWLVAKGNSALAVQVFSAEEAMHRRFAPGMLKRALDEHASALTSAQEALGEEAFAQSWGAGQALTLHQALDEVKRAVGWEVGSGQHPFDIAKSEPLC
jgi:predicted ATPase